MMRTKCAQFLNYIKFLALIAVIGFGAACHATPEGGEPKRPNIIIVLTDDLGYADVGFNGSKDILTPALDKLANNGVIFSAAYNAHPFCGPSRAALMTGRYPHEFGAQFNLPERGSFLGVPENETFISKVLQNAGYHTGAIGKWHLGEEPEYHPNNRGFDDFYGFLGGGHDYLPAQYKKKYNTLRKQGLTHIPSYIKPLEHNGEEVDENEYITDALSREASRFVKDAHNDGKPFFLYLAYNAPHVPLQAKEADIAKYSHIKDDKRRVYAAMVHAVDRGVASLVDSLEKTGELDNTLIIFFSDNGGKLSKGANNSPLKEGKGSVHEGGHRTPMFFHWPNQLAAKQRVSHPILTMDLFPTLAGLAGAKIPKDKKLSGKDIWADLQAKRNPHKDELIFTMRHRTARSDSSVRRNQWKAIREGKTPWKLYNIENDVHEDNDLSEKHPRILRDMVAETEKWAWSHKAPLWFHKHEEGDLWRRDAMPHFDEVFNLDQ